MSHREAISLAHTAECKLKLAANKPDRNLRFLVGHALTLDSVNLRLVQIEEESRVVRQPSHAKSIKFKAADNGGIKQSPLSGRRKSPPPTRVHDEPGVNRKHDVQGYEDEDTSSESESDDLALTRHPSGAAQPARHPVLKSPAPAIEQDDENSSSDDEELEATLLMLQQHLDHEALEKITQNKTDETLASLYRSIQACSCHKSDAPEIKNFWEVPKDQDIGSGLNGFDNLRLAIAEVGA